MARSATLSSKFQISIPKAVRDQQRWEAGQEFVFIAKGNGVLIVPVPESPRTRSHRVIIPAPQITERPQPPREPGPVSDA
jgi:AbrB family looped-hinge helix DNA binding protein